jgi:hypothetical protein
MDRYSGYCGTQGVSENVEVVERNWHVRLGQESLCRGRTWWKSQGVEMVEEKGLSLGS